MLDRHGSVVSHTLFDHPILTDYNIDQDTKADCPKHRGVGSRCNKLSTFDWLSDLPPSLQQQEIVEVQFKNTRKDYYRNVHELSLKLGDYVVVEAENGYDVGMVSLTGELVLTRMHSTQAEAQVDHARELHRLARPVDMERYHAAKAREHETMIRSREIATQLGLDMKIGDVEYQGDGNRAIFYYIADQRVDFRKLIRLLAEAFHVRIEMRQIGARQEAGRIGGIGPCGRALCCATWMSKFSSVGTAAARFQDLPLNPLKLTGQCSKLKCCTNYEVNSYVEAKKNLPPTRLPLETETTTYFFNKCDLLSGLITYSTDPKMLVDAETISVERAKEVIEMNKRGEKPELLCDGQAPVETRSKDILFDNAINRFDEPKDRCRKNRSRKRTPMNSRSAKKDEPTDSPGSGDNANSNANNRGNRRRKSSNRRPRPDQNKGGSEE